MDPKPIFPNKDKKFSDAVHDPLPVRSNKIQVHKGYKPKPYPQRQQRQQDGKANRVVGCGV